MTQDVIFRSQLGVPSGWVSLHQRSTDATVAQQRADELTPDGGIYRGIFNRLAIDDYVLKHTDADGRKRWIDTVRVSSADGVFLATDVQSAQSLSEITSILDRLQFDGGDFLKVSVESIQGDETLTTRLSDFLTYGEINEEPISVHVVTMAAGVIGSDQFGPFAINAGTIANGAFTGPKFASNSLAGKGDWTTAASLTPILDALTAVQQSIANQTNLSAKVNIFGSPLLEVPDSGSVTYQYRLVVKDDEDKLVNLDGMPTLSLVSATGTDRSAYLSAVTQPSLGQYLWTITISSTAAKESLTLSASGTIGAETRLAITSTQVVDYDTSTILSTILGRIGVPTTTVAGDMSALSTMVDTTNTSLNGLTTSVAGISTELAATKTIAQDTKTATLSNGTAIASVATSLAALALKFTGITSLADWIRRIVRKDAGTVSMATAQSEINDGDGTFHGDMHSLEIISEQASGAVASTVVDGFSLDARAQLLSALTAAQDDGTLDPVAPCIPVVSGSDWRLDFTAIGDLAGRSNLIFAMKLKASDADAAALVLIDQEGLKVTSGQAAATPANGAVVVTDEVAGTGYVLVKAAATNVPAGQKRVGLKVIKSTGEIRAAELWRPCVTVVDGIVDATA